MIIEELLHYVRAIFLEMIRVKYWHFIEAGKLPRLSFSAQFLLYSIDVALDEIDISPVSPAHGEVPISRDYLCLEGELLHRPWNLTILNALKDSVLLPKSCCGDVHAFIARLIG